MKKESHENYLDRIPELNSKYSWKYEEDGKVSIVIYNKGWMNRIAQKLFKKPEISYVHLDENGSFIWPLIDGINDVGKIAECVKERFGNDAEPLYERLVKFFQIVESYGFIIWKGR